MQKVEAGSALVHKSGETLNEIVGSVKRVTDIIAEIAAASQEQSTGIDQVNRAVTEMEHVTQSNATQTEELSSTAQSLATQAAQLQMVISRFKVGNEAAPARPAAAPAAPAPKARAPKLVHKLPAPARAKRREPRGNRPRRQWLPRQRRRLRRLLAGFLRDRRDAVPLQQKRGDRAASARSQSVWRGESSGAKRGMARDTRWAAAMQRPARPVG